jgi:hypothetical protein
MDEDFSEWYQQLEVKKWVVNVCSFLPGVTYP